MKFPFSVPCKLSERKGHQSRHQIKQLPAEARELILSIWKGNTLNYVFMHVIAGLYLVSLSSTVIQTYFNMMSKHFWVYNNRSTRSLTISQPFPCSLVQFLFVLEQHPGKAVLDCDCKVFIITKPRRAGPKELKTELKKHFEREEGICGCRLQYSSYSLPKWVSLHNKKIPFSIQWVPHSPTQSVRA